jgi:predicted small metal-binding protein
MTRAKKGGVVEQRTESQRLRVGCVCGWEVVGSPDVVVPAVLEHGEKIHNMSGTPEQVLANAERVVVSEAHEEPTVRG